MYIDRPRFLPESTKAHPVAGLIVAIATALRLTLKPWVAGMPFVVFFPAIIVATFLCGSTAAFLAGLLSVLSAWLFIIPSENSLLSNYKTAIFGVGTVTVVDVFRVILVYATDVRRSTETHTIREVTFI